MDPVCGPVIAAGELELVEKAEVAVVVPYGDDELHQVATDEDSVP